MNRLRSVFEPQRLGLLKTFLKMEFSLMEQGTALGFILAFLNNAIMLLMFHALFVNTFLQNVPNTWLYLLVGIIHWNLYLNVSLGGFASLLYRQKIVMGYSFHREILIFARMAAIFVPYLVELTIILLIALWFKVWPTTNFFYLPLFLICQYLFCVGLGCVFAFVGVLQKNILLFWNITFRLLSFATPIFYIPFHFQNRWLEWLYSANPFTIFMMWIRDIIGANGFEVDLHPLNICLGSIATFIGGYFLYRKMEKKIGDFL